MVCSSRHHSRCKILFILCITGIESVISFQIRSCFVTRMRLNEIHYRSACGELSFSRDPRNTSYCDTLPSLIELYKSLRTSSEFRREHEMLLWRFFFVARKIVAGRIKFFIKGLRRRNSFLSQHAALHHFSFY